MIEKDFNGKCLKKELDDANVKIAVLEEKLKASEIAKELAAENIKLRIDSLNEWRSQNKDERIAFLPRETYEVNHRLLEAKIDNAQRLVYIGLGGVLVLELVLRFLLK
jgi:hypothetical protein